MSVCVLFLLVDSLLRLFFHMSDGPSLGFLSIAGLFCSVKSLSNIRKVMSVLFTLNDTQSVKLQSCVFLIDKLKY